MFIVADLVSLKGKVMIDSFPNHKIKPGDHQHVNIEVNLDKNNRNKASKIEMGPI